MNFKQKFQGEVECNVNVNKFGKKIFFSFLETGKTLPDL